jgi:hypothetical protein
MRIHAAAYAEIVRIAMNATLLDCVSKLVGQQMFPALS